jgi:branched-chain amino acid transport system ATP-binding protein
MTILLVEQNFYSALSLADRCYVIDQGTVAFSGTPDELKNDRETLAKYVHV